MNWQRRLGHWKSIGIMAITVALGLWLARSGGWLQGWELAAYDQYIRWRSPDGVDERITIIKIDDADIQKLGTYPISDDTLAQVIETLNKYQPRVIGLDLYRDLPVPPGHQRLIQTFRNTPRLIGIEKKVADISSGAVPPPPALQEADRVCLSDVVLDSDGKLRRGLLYITLPDGSQSYSLSLCLALQYLKSQGIEMVWQADQSIQIGQGVLLPFETEDGGYVHADAGGYQVLLDWQQPLHQVRAISLSQVLADRIAPSAIRDRIVLIGDYSDSRKDFFFTPHNREWVDPNGRVVQLPARISGVESHAHLTSQLLNTALEGRGPIRVWSKPMEWLWICAWIGMGALLAWCIRSPLQIVAVGAGVAIALVGISYGAFLAGGWLPIVPTVLGFGTAGVSVVFMRYQMLRHVEVTNHELQRLASTDALTQVANRRGLNLYLNEYWQKLGITQESLALILCDVDFFKAYNDTYGHLQGDLCLQRIALAIRDVVQRSSDLVARYGGEEFAIVLPRTTIEDAQQLAESIRQRVADLRIEHQGSQIAKHVTLSLGVSAMIPILTSPANVLVTRADHALYQAKQDGRDRIYSIG